MIGQAVALFLAIAVDGDGARAWNTEPDCPDQACWALNSALHALDYAFVGTCGDPAREAEVGSLHRRYDRDKAAWEADRHRALPFEIIIVEGDRCTAERFYERDIRRLRKSLAEAEKAVPIAKEEH